MVLVCENIQLWTLPRDLVSLSYLDVQTVFFQRCIGNHKLQEPLFMAWLTENTEGHTVGDD